MYASNSGSRNLPDPDWSFATTPSTAEHHPLTPKTPLIGNSGIAVDWTYCQPPSFPHLAEEGSLGLPGYTQAMPGVMFPGQTGFDDESMGFALQHQSPQRASQLVVDDLDHNAKQRTPSSRGQGKSRKFGQQPLNATFADLQQVPSSLEGTTAQPKAASSSFSIRRTCSDITAPCTSTANSSNAKSMAADAGLAGEIIYRGMYGRAECRACRSGYIGQVAMDIGLVDVRDLCCILPSILGALVSVFLAIYILSTNIATFFNSSVASPTSAQRSRVIWMWN